jgi:uncharacterized protein YjaG (DUF416 family)
MKIRKFNLNWQSVVLGMVLCMVLALAVFVTSKTASAQVGGRERIMQQRPLNMNDIWDKTSVLEAKVNAMQEQLNRIEQKIDISMEEQHQILKIVRGIDKSVSR